MKPEDFEAHCKAYPEHLQKMIGLAGRDAMDAARMYSPGNPESFPDYDAWRNVFKNLAVLTLCCAVLLLNACATAKPTLIEPVRFEAEKECDLEHLQLPALDPAGRPIDAADWVQVEDVRIIEQANADCGRKAIEAAEKNYLAAKQRQKPDEGFFSRVWKSIKTPGAFAVGIAIGLLF